MSTIEEQSGLTNHIAEQRDKVMTLGHVQLLTNSKDYKAHLMDLNVYVNEINNLVHELSSATEANNIARIMALLIELDVNDPSRIGEPLIETLLHDLRTKAEGTFEFKKGDKNLATALLQILKLNDHSTTQLIRDLCNEQSDAGIATPFDYRRLTTSFDKEWESATVDDWLDFFNNNSAEELREGVEVGLSFSSTKPQRYSDEKETWLASLLRGKCNNLLDIGGSIGVSSRHLMELLDINTACVTDCRTEEQLEACFYGGFEKQKDIVYVLGKAGDITKQTPDNEKYDLVTVNNVLVHIKDKEEAIKHIIPCINEGGQVLITGGDNTNPPRNGFWLFKKENGSFSLIDEETEK